MTILHFLDPNTKEVWTMDDETKLYSDNDQDKYAGNGYDEKEMIRRKFIPVYEQEYCRAKHEANKPYGYTDCNCHNFCKFDGIQFDSIFA